MSLACRGVYEKAPGGQAQTTAGTAAPTLPEPPCAAPPRPGPTLTRRPLRPAPARRENLIQRVPQNFPVIRHYPRRHRHPRLETQLLVVQVSLLASYLLFRTDLRDRPQQDGAEQPGVGQRPIRGIEGLVVDVHEVNVIEALPLNAPPVKVANAVGGGIGDFDFQLVACRLQPVHPRRNGGTRTVPRSRPLSRTRALWQTRPRSSPSPRRTSPGGRT